MRKNVPIANTPAPGASESLGDCRSETNSHPPGLSYRAARSRVLDEFERRYVAQLLSEAHGNVALAARRGQMDRTYLIKLIRRHGLRSR